MGYYLKLTIVNILKQIPVLLLALIFLVFGLNFFLHFLPIPPATGNAATFFGVIYSTGFLTVVKVLEIIFAILLVIKSTRALALLLMAPIVVNILLYELLIAHAPGIGIVLILLNAVSIYQLKEKYLPIVR
jgi:uncharacterized membrane protein YphA (DoxX/SURF4 family)